MRAKMVAPLCGDGWWEMESLHLQGCVGDFGEAQLCQFGIVAGFGD